MRAYADDLLITCDDHNTVASLIKQLNAIEGSFNLRLIKNKSVAFTKNLKTLRWGDRRGARL